MLTMSMMTIFNGFLCVAGPYYNKWHASERFEKKTRHNLQTQFDKEAKDDDDYGCLIVETEKGSYPLSFTQIELKSFALQNPAVKTTTQQDRYFALFAYGSKVTEEELKKVHDYEPMFYEMFLEIQMLSYAQNNEIDIISTDLLLKWYEEKAKELKQDIDRNEAKNQESMPRSLGLDEEFKKKQEEKKALLERMDGLVTQLSQIRGMIKQIRLHTQNAASLESS
jgi:hypothetical protein